MLRVVAVLVGLAGCDVVFQLEREPGGWAELVVGQEHACGRRLDGAMWCWGGNRNGQVGNGDEVSRIDAPAGIAGHWRQLTTTLASTCAVRDDATLWCWGINNLGQIGIDSATIARIPKQVPGTWSTVSGGFLHVCALDADQHAWCWGYGGAGQLGDGAMQTRYAPVRVDDDARWLAISPAVNHTCAIRDDHTLWCWGSAKEVPLAPDLTGALLRPTQIGTAQWDAVAAMAASTCGITSAGQLRCWGDNAFHQLGVGAMPASSVEPMPVLADGVDATDWTQVAGAFYAACGVRADGSAWCWGLDDRGQATGDSMFVDPARRVEHPEGRRWVRVAMASANACFVDEDERAWCAGNAAWGQLADGGTSHRGPAQLPESWGQIDAGDHVTCAVRDGQLACAGNNAQLQVARLVFSEKRLEPIINGSTGWAQVTSGLEHACALDAAQHAWCWGQNTSGNLGNADPAGASSLAPVAVAGDHGFVAIDGGGAHTCAIEVGGAMYCWGAGSSGQLGVGSFANAPAPVRVSLSGWAVVSAGGNHTCGVTTTGRVACWGANASGQLGIGSTTVITAPGFLQPAADLPAFTQVAAGGTHACAVGSDASLWCWGDATRGQLGVEPPAFTSLSKVALAHPEKVWRSVAAGVAHTCAIRTDGSLWCWGANDRGQLGNTRLDDRRSPTRVDGDAWAAVTCGTDHTCATRTDGTTWCWGDNEDGQLATDDAWTATPREILTPDQ